MKFPLCPGGPDELATIVLGDGLCLFEEHDVMLVLSQGSQVGSSVVTGCPPS